MSYEMDGPRACNVLEDGRIMVEGVGGMPDEPYGRGVIWVTLEQADQAKQHGWRQLDNPARPAGLVQVAR